MPVHQLIYISAARRPMSETELEQVLLRARTKNTRLGVRGMLFYDSGSFLQVLEGEEAVVESLFRVIAADVRHERVLSLSRQSVTQGAFSDWTMGFVDSSHPALSHLPGFRDFSNRALDAAQLTAVRNSAFYLIGAFGVGRLRQFVAV